jgi:hypothetical protein
MDKETGVKQLTGTSDALSGDVGAMSLSQVVRLYVDALGGLRSAADFFGVNPGTVAYALEHEPKRSHKMVRALVRRGAIKAERTRLAADVTEEQREALKKLASEFGCKSWSEFCRQTADHLNTGESFWIDFW